MKVHHKGSVFSRLDIETDKPLFQSPEHRRRKSQMEEDKFDSSEDKRSRRGRFMKTVKTVLFHIKLRRRYREKRIGSDSMRSSSSSSCFRFRKQNQNSNESKSDMPNSASTHSTTSSLLSSSSSSSSSSRLSFQSSEPRTSISSAKNHQNPKPEKHSSIKEHGSVKEERRRRRQRSGGASIVIGLVLFLMSLWLTILYGKVWAIAFNAMWLACVPQKWSLRLRRSELGDEVEDRVVEESVKEVRRRVIMEGLLDRRHHHHHQSWQQQRS